MASMGDAQRVGNGGLSKLTDGPRTTSDLSKVGGGLTRGPNQGKKLNAAAWSETWPAPGSTLDLDFANDRGWVRGVGQGKSMDAVTFTRASNGNYVKSDGTLSSHANQGALGNNLLTFPQDFDNAVWGKQLNASVIANVESKDNITNSVDLLIASGLSGGINQARTLPSSGTYTFSVYVKANNNTWIALRANGYDVSSANDGAYFNVSDGTIGTVKSGVTAAISNEGNGYYRCSITFSTTTDLIGNLFIYLASADDNGYLASLDLSAFIWGAQLELGSTATEYFPTNIGLPRFDWASTAQSTTLNQLSYSDQFNNDVWTKTNTSISQDTAETLDPFGNNLSDKLIEDTNNGTHGISYTITGRVATFSVYVKAAGRTRIRLGVFGSNNVVFLDLTTGTVISGSMSGSINLVDAGNGWWRCIAYVSTPTFGNFSIFLVDSGTNFSYTGDNASGIYLFGAQLELSETATDYVATAANSITRIIQPLAANPTSNGLLIEESRTNRILWCRDATQANWTKTNVTAAKDQTGIDGVANAASSLTATANDGTCIQTITLASGSRTGSVYLKRITGTGNVQVTLDGSTYSTVDLSASEWRRIVISGTVTNPTVGIKIAVSGDAVAMDYGQVEDGAFATSPILTTTASVTRAVDLASMSGANLSWYTQGKGTFTGTFFDTPSLGVYFSISTGNVTGVIQYRKELATTLRIDIVEKANNSFVISTTIPNLNQFNTASIGFVNYNTFIAIQGQAPITDEAAVRSKLMPIDLTIFRIGATYNGTTNVSTYVKRFTYIPQRVSNYGLQELSK